MTAKVLIKKRKAREIIKLKLKCSDCKEKAITFLSTKPYCYSCYQNLKRKLKWERKLNA